MRIEEYIAYRVDDLCKKHRMSRYQLSQLTGITQTALTNIISGRSVPNILTIEKISHAFGITIAQFFSDGGFLDLTEEQREILEIWNALDSREQKIVITFMRGLKSEDS